ncbi:MAG: hypothetical protein Q8P59_08200, partial [Dehalococcoidia bacterium]|nr:hypothetical protein [Dehalococcoidia bacterium]
RLTQLGNARYDVLARDYYKVFVVKRELFDSLAGPQKPVTPTPQGQPSRGDPAALQNLLSSARDAFMSGDLDRVAGVAADMQKAFREQGMNDGADLARQVEQAARARDMKALETLGPRMAQLAVPGTGGPSQPRVAAAPPAPVSDDIILKAIDAEDPVKIVTQYLPPQVTQEMGVEDPARLKLMLIAYFLQTHLQTALDPVFLISEYKKGDIQVYPASIISNLAKLLPIELLSGEINTKR